MNHILYGYHFFIKIILLNFFFFFNGISLLKLQFTLNTLGLIPVVSEIKTYLSNQIRLVITKNFSLKQPIHLCSHFFAKSKKIISFKISLKARWQPGIVLCTYI